MEALQTFRLMPLGTVDMVHQQMPEYRNEATGVTGQLPELSKEPGAMWQATWVPGQPWYARLEDGKIMEVRPEELE